MTQPKAVILDIDGTLLLSNDAHARAFVEAAKAVGISADFDKVRRLIGKGGDKLIPEAFGVSSESNQGKRIDKTKVEIFRRRYLSRLKPTPGVGALLRHLKRDGMKLIVATSSGHEDAERLLERAGVRDLIDGIASADDVAQSKPAPDVVCAALEKSGANKRSAIMIGDTPYDVEAARRAGIRVIALRCGGWTDSELTGAIAVYDDPADLLSHLVASPLAKRAA
jgi:HAD superfamily hydrolase (TIGR01509 family)